MEIYKNIILTLLFLKPLVVMTTKMMYLMKSLIIARHCLGYGIGEFSFTGLKFFENKPLTIYTFARIQI
ncbi:hypothetical protein CM15mP37_09330 [bacterium]|nr:MAG: hypothetical protein CM15mP37_09330 [bacterium]